MGLRSVLRSNVYPRRASERRLTLLLLTRLLAVACSSKRASTGEKDGSASAGCAGQKAASWLYGSRSSSVGAPDLILYITGLFLNLPRTPMYLYWAARALRVCDSGFAERTLLPLLRLAIASRRGSLTRVSTLGRLLALRRSTVLPLLRGRSIRLLSSTGRGAACSVCGVGRCHLGCQSAYNKCGSRESIGDEKESSSSPKLAAQGKDLPHDLMYW